MSASRLAAYVGVGTLMVAWLASAVGVPRQPRQPPAPRPSSEDARVASLAEDVQAQAARLRQRLATAPAPQAPLRNPFTFRAPEPSRTPLARRDADPAPLPELAPVEPVLVLVGIAETATPAGPVRTAMIEGEGQALHMAAAGQQIAGRYRVVTVSVDAVELEDMTTGAIRRLMLR